MADRNTITISVTRMNQATVWNKDDVIQLRKTYRIVGSLIGSLPRKPWQNQVMSLPLLLMPEEVTLLLTKGYAFLKRESEFPPTQTQDKVLEFKELRDKSHLEQIGIFVREREEKKKILDKRVKTGLLNIKSNSLEPFISKMSPNNSELSRTNTEDMSEKTGCRKQNLEDLVKEDLSNKSQTNTTKSSVEVKVAHSGDENTELCCDNKEAFTVNENDLKYYSKSTWVHIPTASMGHLQCVKKSRERSLEWNFPSTEQEKLSYSVFYDLWEKGYYITTGEKFGCDFLVYPGEPSRFHSQFIVLVMSTTRKLSNMELLAYGRLATGVKKTVVLAVVDKTNEYSVNYQSLGH